MPNKGLKLFLLLQVSLSCPGMAQQNTPGISLSFRNLNKETGDRFSLSDNGKCSFTISFPNDTSLHTNAFLLYIDSTDSYLSTRAFDNKPVVNKGEKNFALSYTLYKPGKYTFSLYTKEFKFITKKYLQVILPDASAGKKTGDGDFTYLSNTLNTLYYLNSKVVYAEGVDQYGYPLREYRNITMPAGGLTSNIIITNPYPINSPSLNITIEKENGAKQFMPVERKTIMVENPSENHFHFKYTFRTPGNYRIEIRAQSGIWINDGCLTIRPAE